MPNGGITPDCVHCKKYRGAPRSEGEPFCEHHQMKLAYPIRAFCSAYVDLEPVDGIDWLDSELEREELDDNMMYIWLGGYEITFFHVALAPIEQYQSWTREKFLEELSILSEKYNKD